jgi:hypothetical protein
LLVDARQSLLLHSRDTGRPFDLMHGVWLSIGPPKHGHCWQS